MLVVAVVVVKGQAVALAVLAEAVLVGTVQRVRQALQILVAVAVELVELTQAQMVVLVLWLLKQLPQPYLPQALQLSQQAVALTFISGLHQAPLRFNHVGLG
jgi:hypothetical protein